MPKLNPTPVGLLCALAQPMCRSCLPQWGLRTGSMLCKSASGQGRNGKAAARCIHGFIHYTLLFFRSWYSYR
jgi:hypothetical protein